MRFFMIIAGLALATACAAEKRVGEVAPDSSNADTLHRTGTERDSHLPGLSPLADSIAQTFVFPPTMERWFTGSSRGKRMLVDIGRVDANLRIPKTRDIDSTRLKAFREAMERHALIRKGDRFRLRGPWGEDDAIVKEYDVWNGRIVVVLDAPKRVDSLAAIREPLPVSAERTTEARASVTEDCQRDSIPQTLLARTGSIKDSLSGVVRADTTRMIERLRPRTRMQQGQVVGCFDGGRMLFISSLRAGDYEFVSERAVLVDALGNPRRVPISDLRFKAHDVIYAFDADGDGHDDLAARGMMEAIGGTTILRLVEGKRLERLTSGFAWENR